MDDNDYFSLDAIIAEQTKIPSVFKLTVPGLGHLEGNSDDEIKQHTRIDLPLWLAENLAYSDYVDLSLPKVFSSKVRNALSADPKSVHIRQLSSHYYRSAIYLLDLVSDKQGTLAPLLAESFKLRAREIMDHTQSTQSSSTTNDDAFLSGLDEMERQLYKSGQDSAKAMRTWQDRSDRGHNKRRADGLRRLASMSNEDVPMN